MTITRKYSITSKDMDMDYHITPSAVLLYIQDTVAAFLTRCNKAAFDVSYENILWVITDYNIELSEQQPFWPEEVSVKMWMSELTPLRAYFDCRLTGTDGREFGKATTCWSMIDATTHKPVVCSDHLKDVEIVPEMVYGRHGKAVNPAPEAILDRYSCHTIMPDVDFNSHISNRAYLTTALSGMDLGFERTHTAVRMYLKFVKETFLGDTLHCDRMSCKDSADTFFYRITNDAAEEVCRIWIQWASHEEEPHAINGRIVR